ncbi:MAG: mechanosensitive ion channel family protein [Nitrospiria bacterium]
MSIFQAFLGQVNTLLNTTLFTLGKSEFTLLTLIYIAVLVSMLFYLTKKMKTWIVLTLQKKINVGIGISEATGSILRYVFISIGLVMILQSAGIDLSTFTVFAGALGIGFAFGLQNITSNFVSGIIILFERPIKVGDRIEVKDIHGDVVNISPRATTIVTNDNIAIIVPNSDFITSTVTNWSYTDQRVRFSIPFGVSYHAEPERVRQMIKDVALTHPSVLKNPKPEVLLDEFGDSSLNFLLRVWTIDFTARPRVLKSELNYLIFHTLKEHGIEIPFPQRDLHIRNGAVHVK